MNVNVASLELCQELYELSGWDASTFSWFGSPHPERTEFELSLSDGHQDCVEFPAYDLGYLLRKLSEETTLFSMKKTWNCGLMLPDDAVRATADIPEDAVCKLAIELFKQGVLK